MKDPTDIGRTRDLIEATKPRPLTAAERKRRQREQSGKAMLAVEIDQALLQRFRTWASKNDLSQAEAIEAWIRADIPRQRKQA